MAYYLGDATLRAICAPLRALFAEAAEEGLIDHNPAATVPSGRDRLRDDPEPRHARALTGDALATFLTVVHWDWRLLFETLAVSGLRMSEASALRWQDVALDSDRPHVKVRRSYVAPRFGPPKSKHGKRDEPIPLDLADRLRARRPLRVGGLIRIGRTPRAPLTGTRASEMSA